MINEQNIIKYLSGILSEEKFYENNDPHNLSARIDQHGGPEGFMKHVIGQAGESFAARQHLMAIAQQMNNPDITAGLEEAMKNNPDRLLIWANAIKTPQDLQKKYDDWVSRGIVRKPQGSSGGRVEKGIKNPYEFYRSLTPDQQGDVKGVAFEAYIRGGRIMPPKWAHPNDAEVLIQLYQLIGAKMKQGGQIKM
jgi:hypothetical protein